MSQHVDDFAPLRITRVVRETVDAVSLVLDVPERHSARFAYQAGQFLTLRVDLDGQELRRCYSMSSAPADAELRITVKRDPGGVVSNWLNDTAAEGAELHVAAPEGRFVLRDVDESSDDDLVAFAGGSGITPIISLVRTVLANSARRVRLFYANRDRDSVIFANALEELARSNADRFTVRYHLDDDAGVVTPLAIDGFIGSVETADYYICGPGPFMDAVETQVLESGVPSARVHLERFTVAPISVDAIDEGTLQTEEIVFVLDRATTTTSYRSGDTLLQTARMAGLKAPASCETGSCGTCMAQVVEGSARILNNDALDDDEVAEGWVLTCQSLPTSRSLRVVYD